MSHGAGVGLILGLIILILVPFIPSPSNSPANRCPGPSGHHRRSRKSTSG